MKSIQPNHTSLLSILTESNVVVNAARALTEGSSHSVKGLVGSARSSVVSALWDLGSLPFVVVVPDDTDVDNYAHDIALMVGPDNVGRLHGPRRVGALATGGILHHDHIDVVTRLATLPRYILVLSASSLTLRLPTDAALVSARKSIMRGSSVPLEDFVTGLILSGFERTDFVSKPGEIAVRGGIVDLFPGGWNNPFRVEFWGNTIESIREFEPLSQRSIREHDSVEFVGGVFHDDDEEVGSSVLDHIPTSSIVVLDSPEAIDKELAECECLINSMSFQPWPRLVINSISASDATVKVSAQPSFNASIEQLLHSAARLTSKKVALFVGADGKQNVTRLRELCDNVADAADEDEQDTNADLHAAANRISWVSTTLSEGFAWDDLRLAYYTEHQIFGRQRTQQRTRKQERGFSLRDIQQLHRGDFVVHEDKGIGKFEFLETIVIGGSAQECVKLLFDGGDTLYVHLNYVHKLSKFASEEGAVPKLSKLGTAEWERRKAKAKKRIKDIARDLIKLYAQRKSQQGFSFPSDTVWQKELEASFQYEDTPDQARATHEVKLDMEQPIPMDRLVCGDVGFGKTEVAVRAAFKAAQAGRQVALLVPTTILAEQHGVTFRDRLHRYPVRIDVLSRFRSKQEQREILERIGNASCDIVIGTHRLLSKDVVFKNLGLLIIDEEHRFGVGAKEKLRQLRTTVDTLTLTATPIPRTLNFSLMGARDLSVIETPPRNRLPVRTEILQWADDILREALLRELERGGQVFVVTDKIHDMDKLSMRIKMLVPTLRVVSAHGQMETETLENVMEGFLERKYDVLIATKIIESGLDIPNANTIIIQNADNFGLAELYQLRGRVGRSNAQAYCFLVIPPPHTLSRTALRRLQALEEFTDLGSGFQLAMRDLEIRGAGNLLGGEQSGFIMDMGFELYQKILDEAVMELRNEEFADLFEGSKAVAFDATNEDIAVELDVDALLPKSFVPSDTDRYEFYRRLYNAQDLSEVDSVYDELRDRFGTLPEQAEGLLFAVRMRIAAMPAGFSRIQLQGTSLVIELPPDSNKMWYEDPFQRILHVMNNLRNARFVQQGKRLQILVDLDTREDSVGVLAQFSNAARNPSVLETS